MDGNQQKPRLLAVVDYWIREAFENETSRTFGIVSNFVMGVIFWTLSIHAA